MNIAIIVGSIRNNSYNKMVAKHIVKTFGDEVNFKCVDIESLPFFNEDIENENIESVEIARKIIRESDGVIIITPEYNGAIPGVLKNALDWFSRKDYVLMKKKYLAMGASIGIFGTSKAQSQIVQLLDTGAYQMQRIPNSNVTISNISEHIDEDGQITDERQLKKIDNAVENFIKWVEK